MDSKVAISTFIAVQYLSANTPVVVSRQFEFSSRLADKILSQYVWQKDTKDTIGRYIVLLPEEKVDSCQHDSEWWRVLGARTYIVIDDGVNSIGNAFDCGSARIGEITFLRTCPLLQLTTDLHANYY